MAFKLKAGERMRLPAAFLKKFDRYDYVPPSIVRTPENILRSISDAREVLERHSVKLRNGSSLDQLLSQSEREIRKRSGNPRRAMDLQYVIALTGLIIGLADEDGIKVLLERMAKSEMDTTSEKPSQGKDAAWELSCLSSFKIGGIEARLAEPDIVIAFGYGDYGIACKKIYSENSVEKCVAKGVEQISGAQMQGLVALNIDELLIPARRMMYASDQDFLRAMLQGYTSEFIERHSSTLEKYARGGACDGYIVSASKVAWLVSTSDFSYTTVNIHVPIGDETAASRLRIDAIARQSSSANGLEAWVAKVGGAAFGL
ncbi:hypothetical protein [Pseudomonas sp. BN411]|uniref:hypothetical protein n=1 Tax=Pseudomonas sp. BN411 TaxID=2567887 RepID=UPI0024573DED|nr:hypothetical protein [Pseudomonas sp. BN411]MDH4560787.1 hypothetical protein [Pseudomonas sp. BN411]